MCSLWAVIAIALFAAGRRWPALGGLIAMTLAGGAIPLLVFAMLAFENWFGMASQLALGALAYAAVLAIAIVVGRRPPAADPPLPPARARARPRRDA